MLYLQGPRGLLGPKGPPGIPGPPVSENYVMPHCAAVISESLVCPCVTTGQPQHLLKQYPGTENIGRDILWSKNEHPACHQLHQNNFRTRSITLCLRCQIQMCPFHTYGFIWTGRVWWQHLSWALYCYRIELLESHLT